MTGPDPSTFLGDPLSDISRRERRNLLIASTVGALMVHAGLIPKHISALGIDFEAPEQSSVLVLTAIVVGYFVAAFVTYAMADFMIWREKRHEYLVAVEFEIENMTPDDGQDQPKVPSIGWYYRWSHPVAYSRVFFEFCCSALSGTLRPGSIGLSLLASVVARIVTMWTVSLPTITWQ